MYTHVTNFVECKKLETSNFDLKLSKSNLSLDFLTIFQNRTFCLDCGLRICHRCTTKLSWVPLLCLRRGLESLYIRTTPQLNRQLHAAHGKIITIHHHEKLKLTIHRPKPTGIPILPVIDEWLIQLLLLSEPLPPYLLAYPSASGYAI